MVEDPCLPRQGSPRLYSLAPFILTQIVGQKIAVRGKVLHAFIHLRPSFFNTDRRPNLPRVEHYEIVILVSKK